MSPLDHKLLRDLARMKGQAAAIAAVIGLGRRMDKKAIPALIKALDDRDQQVVVLPAAPRVGPGLALGLVDEVLGRRHEIRGLAAVGSA